MYCRKCGKTIPQDSEFCMHCGTKVEIVEEPTPVPATSKPIASEPEPTKFTKVCPHCKKSNLIKTGQIIGETKCEYCGKGLFVRERHLGSKTIECSNCKHPNTVDKPLYARCTNCGERVLAKKTPR